MEYCSGADGVSQGLARVFRSCISGPDTRASNRIRFVHNRFFFHEISEGGKYFVANPRTSGRMFVRLGAIRLQELGGYFSNGFAGSIVIECKDRFSCGRDIRLPLALGTNVSTCSGQLSLKKKGHQDRRSRLTRVTRTKGKPISRIWIIHLEEISDRDREGWREPRLRLDPIFKTQVCTTGAESFLCSDHPLRRDIRIRESERVWSTPRFERIARSCFAIRKIYDSSK
jgi:hypothetical protein